MFGGYAFQTAGLKLTTPSKAAFITGFFVVVGLVLLALFGSRRVPMWVWLGALSAFAGLYFLAVPLRIRGAESRRSAGAGLRLPVCAARHQHRALHGSLFCRRLDVDSGG